jgi:Tol biopolymer transport system component
MLVAAGAEVLLNNRAVFEVTPDLLVYAPVGSGAGGAALPVWVDRRGNREPLGLEPGDYGAPRISPDGRRVALDVAEGGNTDILVYDIESRISARLTFDTGADQDPVWTPDGSRIVFRSNRDGGALNLYSMRADGGGEVVRLTEGSSAQIAQAFTPDGGLIYTQDGDLWMLPPGTGAAPVALTSGPPTETHAALAPNGRFLAVQSDRAGPREVFVYSFPELRGERLVSTLDIAPLTGFPNADIRDAWTPLWSPTGRELFYRSGVGTLVRVPVSIAGSFSFGTPEVALELDLILPRNGPPEYDVTPDGERVLVLLAVPGERNELIVVQNWSDVLRDRAAN